MNKVTEVLVGAIPVALGVAVGMWLYNVGSKKLGL